MYNLQKEQEVLDQLECIYSYLRVTQASDQRYYYNYDRVLELLEEVAKETSDAVRCERPDNLPEDLLWSESCFDGEDMTPFVYDGSMSADDFIRWQEMFCEQKNEPESAGTLPSSGR